MRDWRDCLVWLKTQRDAAYWEPSAETLLTRVMSPTQVQDPTGAEAMAEGDSSSMETPSSEGKVHGLPEVPRSPEGRGGLEVVSAAGGGPLHQGQVHQEVDGGGSNLDMVPAGQPKVYGPTTSTVVEFASESASRCWL